MSVIARPAEDREICNHCHLIGLIRRNHRYPSPGFPLWHTWRILLYYCCITMSESHTHCTENVIPSFISLIFGMEIFQYATDNRWARLKVYRLYRQSEKEVLGTAWQPTYSHQVDISKRAQVNNCLRHQQNNKRTTITSRSSHYICFFYLRYLVSPVRSVSAG